MKTRFKFLMTTGALTLVGSVFAGAPTITNYNWVAIDSSWSGAFAEATHWKNASTGVTGADTPTRQSQVYIGSYNGNAGSSITADTTVTLPSSDYDTYAGLSIYGPSGSKVLTLDGTGTFRQRTSETDNFASIYPFRLFSWDRVEMVQSYNNYLSESLKYRQASVALTDPRFRIWSPEENVHCLAFDRGTYNFYDPEGYPLTKLGGTSNYDDVRLIWFEGLRGKTATATFASGTSLSAVYMAVPSTGTGKLIFGGGTHGVSKCLDVQAKDYANALALVAVTNGATLTVGSLTVGGTANAPAGGLSRVLIDGSSSLTVSNEFVNAYGGDARIDVRNGSTLCHRGGKFYLGRSTEGGVGTVCVVDSTFDMSEATDYMHLGHFNGSSAAQAQGTGIVALTNSVWTTAKGVNVGSGLVDLENGSVWTNNGSSVSIGGNVGRSGTVVVGADSVWVAANAPAVIGTGTGLFAIRGGTGAFASAVNLAEKSTTGTATLELSDGGVLVAPAIRGGAGTSALTADGGTVRPTAAAGDFLSGVTTATLGAKGLTVDAAFDVTVSQDFTNASGASGRIVKAGESTLTFAAGHAPSAVTLEYAEGTVAFGDTAVTLGGLHLNGGTFTSVAGKTYTVDGNVTVTAANVALPEFDLGTTNTLFTATGTVTGAAAWEAATIVSGRVSGRSYTFMTKENAGITSFQIAVTLPRNADITVAAGDEVEVSSQTKSDDEGEIAVSVGDLGTATVTGPAGSGALIKTGNGRAAFSSSGNVFKGLMEVDAGLLSFASYAAYGWSADCLDPRLILKGGTFAFSGDADAVADLNRSLVVNASVKTDAVVIRSDTGLKLHDPDVKSGALVKTGAGPLVLETDAKCQIASGVGKGDPSDGNGYISGGVYQTPDFDEWGTPPTREYAGLTVFDGELVLRGTSDAAEYTLLGALGAGYPTTNLTVQPRITVDHAKVTSSSYGISLAQYKRNYSSYVTDVYLSLTNGAAVKCNGFSCGYRMNDDGIDAHLLIDDSELDVGAQWLTLSRESGCRMNTRIANGGRLLSNRRVVWDGFLRMDISEDGFLGATAAGVPTAIVAMGDRSSGEINVTTGGVFCIERLFYNNKNLSGFNELTLNFDGGTWDTKGKGVDLLFASADRLALNTTGEGLTMNVDGSGVIQVQKAITGTGGLVKTGSGTLVFETQKIVAAKNAGDTLNVNEINKSRPGDYAVPTVTNEMASVKTLCYAGKTVVREGTVTIADARSVRRWAEFEVAEGATLDLGGNDVKIIVSGEGTVVNGTVLKKGGLLMLVR